MLADSAANELAPIKPRSSPAAALMADILPATQTKPAAASSTLQQAERDCPNGLLTFELSTGFIYKPASAETLAMVPSTLQLTDCLDSCLQNSSCLAINFEMGLCVLLSSSAQQNPNSLYSSQFPVFTIYAEKKCLLSSSSSSSSAIAQQSGEFLVHTKSQQSGSAANGRPNERTNRLASN